MLNKTDVFCAFGDSITAGGLWVAEVFDSIASYGIKVFNCGVAGDTAYDSLRRIETDCLCYNPTVVSVMFGVNDIEHWLDPDEPQKELFDSLIKRYKESMEKVVATFIEKNVKVIVMSPPPYCQGEFFETKDFRCNERLRECVTYARQVAEKNNCSFIDIYNLFSQKENIKNYYKDDRVHLNAKGQRMIAATILQHLGFENEIKSDEDFDFSTLNRERMKIETLFKEIMYAKHDTIDKYCDRLGIKMTKEEMLKHIHDNINSPYPYVAYCAKKYVENIDDLDNIKNELILITEKMVDNTIKE